MSVNKKQKLIQEAVRKELAWRNIQKKYYHKVIMLEEKGYPKDLISEALYVDALKGFVKAIMGAGSSSEIAETGAVEEFRGIVKNQVLQYLIKKIGIDPLSGKGLAISSGIEEALNKLSKDEFRALLKGGSDCRKIALSLGDILGTAVKDGLKEKLFMSLASNMFGDFIKDGSSVMFSGLLISMREKFSDALEVPLNAAIDQFFDSGKFTQAAADMVCDLNLADLIKQINPDFVGDVIDFLKTQPVEFLSELID